MIDRFYYNTETRSFGLIDSISEGIKNVGTNAGTLIKSTGTAIGSIGSGVVKGTASAVNTATGGAVPGIAKMAGNGIKSVGNSITSSMKSTGSWMGKHKILTGLGVLAAAKTAKHVMDNKVKQKEAEARKAEAQAKALQAAQSRM